MTNLDALPNILLMGPGPSSVPETIYHALSRPTLGHLDPVFIQIMDRIKEQLAAIFKAPTGMLTIPLSGTGSSGMEAAFVNVVEPGDRVLILINGVFGQRMQDVATRLGAQVDVCEFAWGTPVDLDTVKAKLGQGDPYKIVAVVHAETSTGVANPVAAISDLLDALPERPLFLVDCVTSLGGIDVDLGGWRADIAYSGTQKCLSCPPGLAPFALSRRAIDALLARKSKVPNWYLDVTMLVKYWEAGGGGARVYHHTAPINMLYGLHAALDNVLSEGLEACFKRHAAVHAQLAEGLEKMGLDLLVEPEARLPMLNAVLVPDGVNEATVRQRLRKDFNIEVGAGLGPLAGKIWRIGLMGHTARPENVQRLLDALSSCLKE